MERWLDIWEQIAWGDGEATLYGLAAIAVLTVLEQVAPAEPGQGWRGRARNLVFLLLFKFFGLASLALWYAFLPRFPQPLITPGSANALLLVVLYLLAIDLIYYGYHCAQHHFPALWALHELHHSDAELDATSSYQTYWLEAPVQAIVVMTPALLIFGGLGPAHGYAVMMGSLFFLIFPHANVRLEVGPLTGWLVGPQVHRVHHSRLPGHRDQNFVQYFSVLDRIFGSFYRPAPGEFPPTGVVEVGTDEAVGTMMVRPFRLWLDGLLGR